MQMQVLSCLTTEGVKSTSNVYSHYYMLRGVGGGVCLMDKAWLYYWQVQKIKIIDNSNCVRVHCIAGLILCKYILGNSGLG